MSHKEELTFWEHLEELRGVFFRMLAAACLLAVALFLCKDWLFQWVLAPHKSDFIVYRGLCRLGETLSFPALCPPAFQVELINIELASQFMIHLKVSFYLGMLIALPYIIYQIYRFVVPALTAKEKQYSGRVIGYSLLLFFTGLLLNYFLIFPLSFRFLATYQVSPEVTNAISLTSYVDTFVILSLMMGIMAELPVVSWFLAKVGIVNERFMKQYRKHAIVLLLVVAAIITPTTDIFTLLVVFVPIYLLYELSIRVVRRCT